MLAQGMATEMARRGYETVVFTPSLKAAAVEDPLVGLRSAGGPTPAPSTDVRVRYLAPRLRYGNAAWIPNLSSMLKGFDVVHFLYPFFGAAEMLPLIRKRTGVKIVLHHTMDAVAPGFRGALFRLYNETLMPLIFKQAHVMITLSEDYFRDCDITNVYANFPDAPNVEFVPNGVDTELFIPRGLLNGSVADENGFVASAHNPFLIRSVIREPTILFASGLDRAHYFKGVHVLIAAMRMLKEQGIKCRAQIIGDGKMRKEYEAHAKEIGVDAHIKFLGLVPHEKLPEYYRQATVAVIPSTARVECFSIVAAEAQACGIPAIVSDFPGVRVTVEDGKTGFVVRPGDPQDLADKIRMVLDDPERARKMGEAGRARAEQLYSWQGIGDKLQRIYEGLYHP